MLVAAQGGCTPLHHAASAGKVETVRQLLQVDPDVEALNWVRSTPRHTPSLASRLTTGVGGPGHCAVFGVCHPSDPGVAALAMSQFNETPLHVAVRGGHLEVVELLLRANANVAAENNVRLPAPTLLVSSRLDSPRVARLGFPSAADGARVPRRSETRVPWPSLKRRSCPRWSLSSNVARL